MMHMGRIARIFRPAPLPRVASRAGRLVGTLLIVACGTGQSSSQTTLTPAGAKDEYFPILFLEPRAANRTALGYDLASSGPRQAALIEARDSGRPVATTPLHLLQDTSSEMGFIV